MEWLGRVGEVREVFRSKRNVVFDWTIPKIFSMPTKIGSVYYSPEIKFMDEIWFLGIHRNCEMVEREWIGLDIWRSDKLPRKFVTFSVGMRNDDGTEEMIQSDQIYPESSRFCTIDKFLLASVLLTCKAQLAPSDVLTVTCTLWGQIELCEEVKRLVSGGTELDEESADEALEEEPISNGIEGKGDFNTSMTDGVARKELKEVYWEVDLPKWQQTHWSHCSPNFILGKISYNFSLYPGGLYSDGVYLRFVIKISDTAIFPLHLRWQMGVKMDDAAGFRWLMNTEMTVKEKCCKHVQQVRVRRVELECLMSPDDRLTFFHQLEVGILNTSKHVSMQTEEQCLDETEVSGETQTEESVASTKEKHSHLKRKEFEAFRQHVQLWLEHPEVGDHIRHLRRQCLKANHGKSIWKLPKEEKEPLIFAA